MSALISTYSALLYLDFDGVLHDDAVFVSAARGIHIRTPGRALFEWLPILDELMAPHPQVGIVLSTNWVKRRNFTFARRQLTPALQARVVGATYHHREINAWDFDRQTRYEQILADVNRRGVIHWMALDNDAEGWPTTAAHRLIQTEDHKGLSSLETQAQLNAWLKNTC